MRVQTKNFLIVPREELRGESFGFLSGTDLLLVAAQRLDVRKPSSFVAIDYMKHRRRLRLPSGCHLKKVGDKEVLVIDSDHKRSDGAKRRRRRRKRTRELATLAGE